jgi:hypothetical protein
MRQWIQISAPLLLALKFPFADDRTLKKGVPPELCCIPMKWSNSGPSSWAMATVGPMLLATTFSTAFAADSP